MPNASPQNGAPETTPANLPRVLAPYLYMAAGRLWVIPQVRIELAPDGTPIIPGNELTRITHAVTNELCGSPTALSADELDFLCGITATPYVDVARRLDVTRATISHWIKKGGKLPLISSLILKKFFWFEVFGSRLQIPLSFSNRVIQDEGALLEQLRLEAISHGLTEPLPSTL